MADPGFAAVAEMLSFRTDIWDELEKDAATASTGFVATTEALRNDLEGDFAFAAIDNLEAERAALGSILGSEGIRAGLEPIVQQLGVAIGSPNAGQALEDVWTDLYDYFIDNAQSIEDDAPTYGTPSAASGNTGNGEIIRCTVDENGYNLAGWWADSYTIECTADGRTTGDAEVATFKVFGTDAEGDEVDRTGTGLLEEGIPSLNARSSQSLVQNPSFSDFVGTANVALSASTDLPGWTFDTSAANFIPNQAITYRPEPGGGDNASTSLELTDNDGISQDLVSVNGASFDFDRPYVFGVAVYGKNSDDSTAEIRLCTSALNDGIANTVASPDGSWSRLWLVATPAANNWPENFNLNTLTLYLNRSSGTTGSLIFDDIIAAPMTRIGAFDDSRSGRGSMGQYIAVVGGTTAWVKGDKFTWTDSSASRGVNTYWIRAGNLGYLPNVPDAATQVTAAGGRTLTFADATDTITASSGDFTTEDFQVGQTLTVAGTSSNNGTYQITALTATVITVEAGDLADEGPLSATATLDAAPSIADK